MESKRKLQTKTHSQRIRDAINQIGEGTATEIIKQIESQDQTQEGKRSSYFSDIIGSSKNHSSTHNYPLMQKFLWFDADTKKYRLADPSETVQKTKPSEDEEINGTPIAKVKANGFVKIPTKILEQLDWKTGDLLGFEVKEKDIVAVRKVRIRLDFS